jgi:AraC-like DNA-binding protein
MQWLLQQRVLFAQRLPEESELPIDEIARRAGFTNGITLRRHFRRHLGVPPPPWAPVRCSIASYSGNNGRPALDNPLVTDITDPASSRTTLWPDSIGLLGGTATPA